MATSGQDLAYTGPEQNEFSAMQMPIVVEQNFRENFSIASATPAYQRLLAAAPGEFAGSVSRLAAIVELLSEGVKRAFAEQGLPLPPWRRAKSVMSKWGMGPNAHGGTLSSRCKAGSDSSCPGHCRASQG